MVYACFCCGLLTTRTRAGRSRSRQQPLPDAIASPYFFIDLSVGHIFGFDRAERFMKARIELDADGFHGDDVEGAQGVFHLFRDQLDAGAELFGRAAACEREAEVVKRGQELLDGGAGGVVAKLRAFLVGAPARIFELGLQAREAVEQAVTFAAQPLVFAFDDFDGGGRACRALRAFNAGGDVVRRIAHRVGVLDGFQ
jgi:hypothetical protein